MNLPEPRLPESVCLGCGEKLNAAASVFDDDPASPGDATICLHCGHLMIFADDMTLRNPNDKELKEIAGDRTLLMAQRIRAKYWKETGAKR